MSIYLTLFLTFFKIGLFTFGGGYAMIPMIQQDVLAHGWLSASDMIDFIAISESTPGPFAVNIATFVGMSQGGLFGSFCATLGVVLPSFIIIVIIAKWFSQFQYNKWVQAALYGLRPAVVGLIAAAALSILISSVANGAALEQLLSDFGSVSISWSALIIAAIVFAASRIKKKMHPIWLILIAGLLGILMNLLFPALP